MTPLSKQVGAATEAHLFIVNSSVTLQITRSVIEHLGLQKDQVIVLAGRRFHGRLVSQFDHVWDLDTGEVPTVPLAARFWVRKAALTKFDSYVKQRTMGRTFRVYLPHTILPLYQLLATHPSCVGFSYIEEGIVAYRPNSEVKNCIPAMIPNLSGIQKWVMRGRWDMEWPFDKRAEAAYGFSSSSFSTIGVPVVVQEPNWSVSSDLAKRYDHSVLCILGPARTLVKSSWNPEQYYWMIMQLAEILVHTDRKIFVRFHPDQKDDERRLILRLFNEKIPGAEVASDEDQAEAICASADVVIVQAGSSVGLYADQLGKPVYGYLDLMQEIAPRAVQSWVDTRSQMSYSFRERDIRTFGN